MAETPFTTPNPKGDKLTGWTAATWRTSIEDPRLRSPMAGMFLLDTAPDAKVLEARFERLTRQFPVLRQRIVPQLVNFTSPRMVVDENFDIRLHLNRVLAPAPGDWDYALTYARRLSVHDLDRDRPLWRATLIEGLTGGRAALVMVLHHAIADGQGMVMLMASLVDWAAEAADLGPMPPAPEPGVADPLAVTAEALLDGARRLAGAGIGTVTGLPALAAKVVSDPVQTVGMAVTLPTSALKIAQPHREPLSPLMTRRSTTYTFRTLDIPFQELRDAGKRHGNSVNDAFIAGITGGMRRYHERDGKPATSLRFNVPISTRMPAAGATTNAVSIARLEFDVTEPDPVKRMAQTKRVVGRARREPAHYFSDAFAELQRFVPAAVIGRLAETSDITASNVPGPPAPVWVCGVPVIRLYPLVATIGAAVNVTLVSYARTWAALGVSMDDAAVPDPDTLMECLAEGYAELGVTVDVNARDPLALAAAASSGAPGDANASAATTKASPGATSSSAGAAKEKATSAKTATGRSSSAKKEATAASAAPAASTSTEAAPRLTPAGDDGASPGQP